MAKNEDPQRVSFSAPQHPALPPTRPTIALPPRPSMETLFTGGAGASPGPMTLVSSFFSDNHPDWEYRSFSQLLAGAIASPMAAAAARPPTSFFTDNTPNDGGSLKEGGVATVVVDKNSGFKQSRPMNLVVARSPLFTVPPGLSPSGLLNSPGFFSPQSPFGMSHQQALAQVTAQAALAQSQLQLQAEYHNSLAAVPTESMAHDSSFISNDASQEQAVPSTINPRSSLKETTGVSISDRKYQSPPLATDKSGDDGYNWRKYGQKQVKGSEFPRSYYKCTHPNCPVKKKVERSTQGQITEIIYKGQHNHEQPQSNKRAKDAGDQNGNANSQAKPEISSQNRAGHVNRTIETVPSQLGLERDQEFTQTDPLQVPGSSDSEELADTEVREDEGDADKPNAKRRNVDVGTTEVALSHKTVTEPKIIVQTRSEVDLLDDGYRWRKYGQKVVKGNPHPRSYYKCTSAGCNVRKHVERASTDPKAVITTYEGKHNHDVPAARNSSHNTANNNGQQLKPVRVTAEKHSLLKDQRPVLLQLKEEQIIV
ncbi:probable WRKY transcription factor 3 [Ziziphus jujuba]|uniref:Probable WRKY transcription factor 3 n=1 Tax=Ziziphus jujuba TaxID=326968 RepID=A0ABM3IFS8_ZIZJJ|nr:probable WRKY transcription factor 3 [Ziziphus jujuba]